MKIPLSPFRSQQKTWVELPSSKYGIQYVLGGNLKHLNVRMSPKAAAAATRFWSNKKPSKMSPFENLLEQLNEVTRRDGHGDGTALMYIREIFEPGDSEYDYIGDYVCASQLSQEQVGRLRMIFLPPRREEILVTYLDRFKDDATFSQTEFTFNESSDVLEHFEEFHRRYLAIEDPKTKFDLLFGFCFAIKHRSEWIFKYESQSKRERMIASLAKHWRNLIARNTAKELGLDPEFSYPALLTFLNSFKKLCDSIETFGNPPISFVYKPEGTMKMVTFDDETVSSLTRSKSA